MPHPRSWSCPGSHRRLARLLRQGAAGPSALLAGLLAAGCGPQDIEIQGIVTAAPGSSAPADGATVQVRTRDFELFAETVAGFDGAFVVAAPSVEDIFVVVELEGAPPTVFPGQSGVEDVFDVPLGQLWSFPAEELAAWREQFAGCPGADSEEGGTVLGEVRLDLDNDPIEAMSAPVATFGFARLTDLADPDAPGATVEACYLDDEGVAVEEGRERVGPVGRFAFFGVPDALRVLVAGRFVSNGGTLRTESLARVPEGAVIARLPVAVPL